MKLLPTKVKSYQQKEKVTNKSKKLPTKIKSYQQKEKVTNGRKSSQQK
jgi:hypothetical protein